MERFFNTAGPQTPQCYSIDPLTRFDLDDVLTLIQQQRYFVMHAPRQTGKTTCMLALRDYLNTNLTRLTNPRAPAAEDGLQS